MKTFTIKEQDIKRKWFVVDGEGKVLGRLATEIARILRGKHKPCFSPHLDVGDHVIVVNADKLVLTGNKLTQKMYHRHTGYPGGLVSVRYDEIMAKRPEMALTLAVRRMLPRNRLGRRLLTKLKVYSGTEHPHGAQAPEGLEL